MSHLSHCVLHATTRGSGSVHGKELQGQSQCDTVVKKMQGIYVYGASVFETGQMECVVRGKCTALSADVTDSACNMQGSPVP